MANGVLISGMAGGESTTRGFLDGWDPEPGKKLWRRYTIPAPGEPGSETWPKDNSDAWKYGGGATWRRARYDPELDLVYWGTGNAEPYNPRPRRRLDSLYTSSVLAIRPKTGEIVWHYQYMPNDVYDWTAPTKTCSPICSVNGQSRKVMISAQQERLPVRDRPHQRQADRRASVREGELGDAHRSGNGPSRADAMSTSAPLAGETVEIWPSRGTNATLIAFNPNTGLVYMNSWKVARIMKYVEFEFVLGQGSTGVESSFKAPDGEPWGYHMAFDPLSGKAKWKVPLMELASSAGMLATDGGLLFTGLLNGEFIALDQDTGQTLWKFKTGSAINSPPITYTYQGRQFVTVLSGIGGAVNRRLKGYDLIPVGGSVTTFALMPE